MDISKLALTVGTVVIDLYKMMYWDDNERGPYIAYSSPAIHEPDMSKVLKDIVLMSRNQNISSVDDEEEETDIEYVAPEMYYEYPNVELPEYIVDDTDEEFLEELETEALNVYFEQCYDSLCKNKYAYS